jgi:hypothetical protein
MVLRFWKRLDTNTNRLIASRKMSYYTQLQRFAHEVSLFRMQWKTREL